MKKIFKAIWIFLKEVKAELQKVVWLSRKQVIDYTFVVIALSLAAAIFIGGADYLFVHIINKII